MKVLRRVVSLENELGKRKTGLVKEVEKESMRPRGWAQRVDVEEDDELMEEREVDEGAGRGVGSMKVFRGD